MAIKSNIVIDQGTDFEVTINVRDANTTAIALTGFTGQAQIRKYYNIPVEYSISVVLGASAESMLQGGRCLVIDLMD